jgi:hypothetical protein
MPTISVTQAAMRPLRPMSAGLAALVEAAASRTPVSEAREAAATAASLGLAPAPPTGRAVLADAPAPAGVRLAGREPYPPVRPLARSGTRLLDLTA